MFRYFLKGAAGIALFALAGLGLVHWATSDPEPRSILDVQADPSGPDAPSAAAPAPPGGGAEEAGLTAEQRLARARAAMPVVPRAVSVDRRVALRNFRRDLSAGLGALQGQVAHCELAGAGLTLSLESEEGAVRVVGAEPTSPSVSGGAIDCARQALTGQVVEVAGAVPGRRWQLPFSTQASR